MRLERKLIRDSQNPFEIPEQQFIKYFRLTKHLFHNLVIELRPHSVPEIRESRIPFHLRMLITLYFLSNGSYQTTIGGHNFNCVSQSVVSRSISEICTLITRHLMPQYIKFPTTFLEKSNVKENFFLKWHIRGILGAIDGTHVEIIAPFVNDLEHPPFVYINRKGKHSINVMLICDANNIIIGINARYPGSVHDAAIWQVSEIRNYLRTCYHNGDRGSFLIGDSGYGQEPWLLTPYANFEEGSPEERYNMIHKRARNVIERTNGILKSRFRCLLRHRVLNYHPAKAAYIIYSCAVLHNIAITAKLDLDDVVDENYEINENEFADPNPDINEDIHEGRRARNLYVQQNFL